MNIDYPARLSTIVYKIGDSGIHQVIKNLEAVAGMLIKDFETQDMVIIKTLTTCATDLPMKSETYACLVAMINSKNASAGEQIVTALHSKMQEAIDNHDYHSLKTLVLLPLFNLPKTRFVGCLVLCNAVTAHSYLSLLDNFLNVAKEFMVKPERADAFVYIVLAVFPWIYSQISIDVECGPQLVSRLDKIREYVKTRTSSSINATKVYKIAEKQIDELEWLMLAVEDLVASDESSDILERPSGLFENITANSTPYDFKPLVISMDDNTIVYPFQGTHSSLLNELPTNALPPTNSVHKFILVDAITDTLRIFSHNHKECAAYLLRIPGYLYSTRIEDFHYAVTTQIVETVLAHIIQLPKSLLPQVYYHSVLFNVFTEDAANAPAAIGKCIRQFFDKLDTDAVDVECVRRFAGWFSHHLSNFGYIWKWSEWVGVCEDSMSMKYVFLRECLVSCVRFGYYDRIKTTVPEVYVGTVLASAAPRANFIYERSVCEDTELLAISEEVLAAIKARSSFIAIETILAKLTTQEMTDTNQSLDTKHQLIIQCLMQSGSKSFSHTLNTIERNLDVLKHYASTPELRKRTIDFISEFWNKNTQFLEITLDKLVNYGVLDIDACVEWSVSELGQKGDQWFVWSILKNATNKVNLKVVQVQQAMATSMDESGNELFDEAKRDQKHAFITLFMSFKRLIEEKIKCDGEGVVETKWWTWVSGCFSELGRSVRLALIKRHA